MTQSWKRKPLEKRAPISAAKPGQQVWPRRFILFGPRVVPLEQYLLTEARAHRSFQLKIARLTGRITELQHNLERRRAGAGRAFQHIKDLKARVAQLEGKSQ